MLVLCIVNYGWGQNEGNITLLTYFYKITVKTVLENALSQTNWIFWFYCSILYIYFLATIRFLSQKIYTRKCLINAMICKFTHNLRQKNKDKKTQQQQQFYKLWCFFRHVREIVSTWKTLLYVSKKSIAF